VDEVVAGLAALDKARRLDMFRLLHEFVSNDSRKAIAAGSNEDTWRAINETASFCPSWEGNQPSAYAFSIFGGRGTLTFTYVQRAQV